MATNKGDGGYDESDSFIRNLMGLPFNPNITSSAVAEETQRLRWVLTGDRHKRPLFSCPHCHKGFGLIQNRNKHVKLGRCQKNNPTKDLAPVVNRCPEEMCQNKTFSTAAALKRHMLLKHPSAETARSSSTGSRRCDACFASFSTEGNRRRHLRKGTCRGICCFCSNKIPDRHEMLTHVREHINSEFLTVPQLRALRKQQRKIEKESSGPAPDQTRKPSSSDSSGSSSDSEVSAGSDREGGIRTPEYHQERSTNFNQTLVKFRIQPVGDEIQDMMQLFSNRRQQFTDNIKNEMKRFRGAKWHMCITVNMTKYGPDGEIKDHAKPSFRSVTQTVLAQEDIPAQIDAAYFKCCNSLEVFKADGSGWRLDEIVLVEQTVLKYNPLRGSCSVYSLPEHLKRKACLLSVTGIPGNSQECFKWAVLAGMKAPRDLTGEIHFSEISEHRNSLSFDGIEDRGKRMPISQIPDFERRNKISINIIGYENEPFPLYISKNLDQNTDRHVNLLLIGNAKNLDSDGHYCVIQSMSRLLCGETRKGNGRLYYCMRCLTAKPRDQLADHERVCSELQPMNCVTVSEEMKWLEFRNYRRQIECPFVIVADFETYSCRLYDANEPTEGRTVRERRLEPCAFAYFRLSRDDCYPASPVVYVGKDADDTMSTFLKCMDEEQEKVSGILSRTVPTGVCDTGVQNLMKSNDACWSCSTPFLSGEKVCVDHDHMTGTIRGNCCNRCNLQLREPNFLPILTHNMSKFDGRLIMSAVGKYGHKNIRVLPQSVDTYVSIMIGKCRYLDSKRFMNASLEALVESVRSENGPASFKYLSQFMPKEHLNLFTRKQVFCYDYLDGPERLAETCLPPRSAFYDRLSETEVSDREYEHVQKVWNAVGMRTLREFLETYLLCDVLLLADVLSIFRKTMLDSFSLDPMQYFSLSGYSFDCALRKTETKIELLTCLEMHQMIENSVRGGLATIGSPRYAKANNSTMPEEEYDPESPTSFIHFFDFNGLYTSVMKNYRLPSFGFRWLSETELERFDVMSIPASSDHGYIVECDLHYPEELHDRHDSFPLAPEHVKLKSEDLSEYTKKMAEQCGINLDALGDIRKLCLTLRDKNHYVTHYMNLQFYLKHGIKLTKVHRVIRFTQTPWLEDFMTFVGDQRRGAKSKFYQTIFKAIPNSTFGKLLECVRNHKDVKICTSVEKLHKLVSRPTFATLHEFGENVAAVQMHKERVVLNRPYAVGFCVLELAKLETYKFYYEFVQPAFKEGSVALLTQDTDSFLIKIDGLSDVNKILKRHSHLFDFSNLPDDHELKSDENRLKPGYVKFELGAEVCCEFCALSPKCYSLRTDSGFKQTIKGSKRRLSHERYKECLLREEYEEEKVREIKNYGQELYQVSVLRRVLNPIDTKRYYLGPTESLSFGHYKIGDISMT